MIFYDPSWSLVPCSASMCSEHILHSNWTVADSWVPFGSGGLSFVESRLGSWFTFPKQSWSHHAPDITGRSFATLLKCSYNIFGSLKFFNQLESLEDLTGERDALPPSNISMQLRWRKNGLGIRARKIQQLITHRPIQILGILMVHDASALHRSGCLFSCQMLSATAAGTYSWWCLGSASWMCRASCAFQTSAPTSYAVMWWLKIQTGCATHGMLGGWREPVIYKYDTYQVTMIESIIMQVYVNMSLYTHD